MISTRYRLYNYLVSTRDEACGPREGAPFLPTGIVQQAT